MYTDVNAMSAIGLWRIKALCSYYYERELLFGVCWVKGSPAPPDVISEESADRCSGRHAGCPYDVNIALPDAAFAQRDEVCHEDSDYGVHYSVVCQLMPCRVRRGSSVMSMSPSHSLGIMQTKWSYESHNETRNQ
ncbi:hypothetical protein RRF57_007737 [Xylaria bambusicola]|uniref:Uncharacterized protein n=1 Tax=Xylaria bambusicola TaxID=326684 RepID=A0AAN7ULL8_9PEZI